MTPPFLAPRFLVGIVGPGGLPAMRGNTLGRSDLVATTGGSPEMFTAYSLLDEPAPPGAMLEFFFYCGIWVTRPGQGPPWYLAYTPQP